MTDGEPTLGELGRRLDRAERDCERRASEHVHTSLYTSQYAELRREIGELRAAWADDRKTARQARQWAIGAVVIPLVVVAVSLLVAVTA